MPKSKVRKKTDYTLDPTNRTPVKVKAAPSSTLYLSVMFGFMLLGLVYLIVYYLAQDDIAWMANLGAWNLLIGFGFWIIGLVMTMKWR
ncbi:cell division protein CrgA [Rhodococcoides corynebacterioides]|uniref:Cell division protein CrgA n=1 Tax=Rhodococcoides corynebacterioides TaxID=53972 RepID=A0ABS7P3R0_9NOCA|nr:cell division protein CrgA [Rhodococcus corynebacterioides]MBY6367047.1 cell division protein CrgA [Rhodococcus corynebacterioides]MBY6407308.1 cell division protein CrgA [Rhodococcus corynebacterioides]